MNRTFATLPLMVLVIAVAPVIAAEKTPPVETAPAATPEQDAPAGLSVDYVLGLLEAGMQEGLIVDLINARGLRFDLRPGDLDRLLAAGAGDALIGIVVRNGRQVDPQSWSRPRRIEAGSPAGEKATDGEAAEEAGEPAPAEQRWYGGIYAYVGAPYWYGYWSYPYPYPYYYSYSYPYYYGYPYRYGYPYHYGYGRHYRPAPPRGYTGPRSGGWHSYPPRGSGSAPRGGSPGGHPPSNRSPRGSHN